MAELAAVEALAVEAADEQEAGTFEYGGRTWELAEKLDLRAIAALQRGDFNRALTLVLGREQTQQLLDLDTDEPLDEGALARMFDGFAAAQGSTRGESSASRRS